MSNFRSPTGDLPALPADDPMMPDYDPRIRVLYGPSSRKLNAEDQLLSDGYVFRRAASRADLLADLALFAPHILLLQWEPQPLERPSRDTDPRDPEPGALDPRVSSTQRLLEFMQGYLRINRLPIVLLGQGVPWVADGLRHLGVRGYAEVGATQAIRETVEAIAAARKNPTLWDMLWRQAA